MKFHESISLVDLMDMKTKTNSDEELNRLNFILGKIKEDNKCLYTTVNKGYIHMILKEYQTNTTKEREKETKD